MLKYLKIKKFALISFIELKFDKGLNVLTGETGAGKSVIVDALMMLLGEKASPDYVRRGEKKAVIEAVFRFSDNHPIYGFLKENDYDADEQDIVIRREILAKGSSRSFVNDTPAQYNFLKEAGSLLVDFHGQHEHQQLLKKENHIDILDILAGTAEDLGIYKKEYSEMKQLRQELDELVSKEEFVKIKAERQRFDLREIKRIDPQPDEEQQLVEEINLRENSEELVHLTGEVYSLLYEGDFSVNDKLASAKKSLERLAEIDKSFSVYLDEIESAAVTVKEIAVFTGAYKENINFDPHRLEEIRERITKINGLVKKYGSFENIFSKKKKLEDELSFVDQYDDEIIRLKREIREKQSSLGAIASVLSKKRKTAAKNMSELVPGILKELGIDDARFEVLISRRKAVDNAAGKVTAETEGDFFEANPRGIDFVEFLISTNAGEPPRPIRDIASGGEISRVMLAVKTIAASSDRLPMLVFDEIDSGISGRIGRKVGIAMKELAQNHQIIAVTHLPQIAALSDIHVSVRKRTAEGNTFIEAFTYKGNDKINEVAKLISGEEISETAFETAKELAEYP